jgi:HEAT repeat protein
MMKWVPEAVVAELERSTPDRRPVMRMLEREADPRVLAEALATAEHPFTRQLLCDMLGNIRAGVAVDVLLGVLSDDDVEVRAAAADAIGKVFGYTQTPPPAEVRSAAREALLNMWEHEESGSVRSTLTQTLALLGDPSVRAILERALDDSDERVRRQASWGLEYLRRTGAARP